MVDQAVNVLPQIKGGTSRRWASHQQRLPQLPNVPTIDAPA